jgi:hypothetical protein
VGRVDDHDGPFLVQGLPHGHDVPVV